MAVRPYLIRRRATLYLRVRVPSDLAIVLKRTHITRTLQTRDAREARARAVRILESLEMEWESTRERLRALVEPPLQEVDLTIDECRTLAEVDIPALPPEEQRQAGDRLQAHLHMNLAQLEKSLAVNTLAESFIERLRLVTDQLRFNVDRREFQAANRGLVEAAQGVLRLAAAGPNDAPTPSAGASHSTASRAVISIPSGPGLSVEAGKPWTDFKAAFFKDSPSIGSKARTSHEQAFAELEALIGAKPIGMVTAADIKRFADYLRDKPINRGGRMNLSHATIVKLLQHVRSFFAWAKGAAKVAANVAEDVKPRKRSTEERRAETADPERRALTTDEVRHLFDSPLFTGCASLGRRAKRGSLVVRDERYWFFLCGLMMGGRPEELTWAPAALVQLAPGLDCLDLRKSGTKTPAAPRLVPVPTELRRAGFIEWANGKRARGDEYLFQGGRAPKDWSKWTNRYLDSIGLDHDKVAFYSLRHVYRQMLRAADIKDELANKVFGHTNGKDKVGQRYGRLLSPGEAQPIIERLKSPIPLDHLYSMNSKSVGITSPIILRE